MKGRLVQSHGDSHPSQMAIEVDIVLRTPKVTAQLEQLGAGRRRPDLMF